MEAKNVISASTPFQLNSSDIPTHPGIYIFQNDKKEILYIGKAKNLRSRVRSYFANSEQSQKTKQLVQHIQNIDWIVVDNEVEALLLENTMIKEHTPKYNIDLKDAKTFAYIALSREPYPRIFSTRKPSSKLETYGPYTDGYSRRELQRLIVKIFKLRICKKMPKRACLNFHIGLCTAPCITHVTKEQYLKQVEKARSFLKGEYEEIREILNLQMQKASQDKEYERALELRNQIASIDLLTQHQIVDSYRGYDQDVFAFRRLGERLLIIQLRLRKGVLMGKKDYSLDFNFEIEQEFLKHFYSKKRIPHEILLNKAAWKDNEEKTALEEYFSTLKGTQVSLKIPQKGEDLHLIQLAEKNIEVNLAENSSLVDLQTALNLPTLPRIIECFDVSNLGKEHVVSGMVRYSDGKPDKRNYRRFKIKTVKGQDDVASIQEVVLRRYKRLLNEKSQLPDLVVVDGGSNQVNAAKSALKSLDLQIPLIGLAKKHEEIFLPNETHSKKFNKNSRMMLLLRRIRDSAHNFSIKYYQKRRQMKTRKEFSMT
ncbi:MAG: excinuclease ABC subunit UvrC [Candidatus Bathyarchaeota archaeon]|nr:MAG: excinuclease ABC subunit UvrC [Candidatus Bathyarchaeota archaeon]